MSILFILASTSLILFMILATYDGLYLHLYRYQLFSRIESFKEHITHTIRASLFPLILLLLVLIPSKTNFYLAIALIILDLVVLGLDAFMEEESRAFMGGLPKWEYIIHLFANGFHFTSFVLIVATRLTIVDHEIKYSYDYMNFPLFELSQTIAEMIVPGAIALAVLHTVLCTSIGKRWWKLIFKKQGRALN